MPDFVEKSQVSEPKKTPGLTARRPSASNVNEDEETKERDPNFADGFDFDIDLKKKRRTRDAIKDSAVALKTNVKEKVKGIRKDIKEEAS